MPTKTKTKTNSSKSKTRDKSSKTKTRDKSSKTKTWSASKSYSKTKSTTGSIKSKLVLFAKKHKIGLGALGIFSIGTAAGIYGDRAYQEYLAKNLDKK